MYIEIMHILSKYQYFMIMSVTFLFLLFLSYYYLNKYNTNHFQKHQYPSSQATVIQNHINAYTNAHLDYSSTKIKTRIAAQSKPQPSNDGDPNALQLHNTSSIASIPLNTAHDINNTKSSHQKPLYSSGMDKHYTISNRLIYINQIQY